MWAWGERSRRFWIVSSCVFVWCVWSAYLCTSKLHTLTSFVGINFINNPSPLSGSRLVFSIKQATKNMVFQLMVNCWNGLVIWILIGSPKMKGIVIWVYPDWIPNHHAPNQQLTIGWFRKEVVKKVWRRLQPNAVPYDISFYSFDKAGHRR